MKVLCVTHSSRPFVEQRSSLNALGSRFGPDRLKNLPPLESLPGIDAAISFTGMLTLWKIIEGPEPALHFLKSYDPGYKVQSAAFRGDRLLVCGSDRLEVLDTSLKPVSTIRDNWIAGGHTVFVDAEGYAWLTSSPANAILRVDIDAAEVVERLPLPEIYGTGYDVQPHHDLRQHFVPTDSQPTHVNCAYPTDGGVLVTLLIPGAVGVYGRDRNYREVLRGFRGCHGGKLDPNRSEIYLTDSPAGLVWFFDAASGEIKGRIKVESHWLHDAHMISNELLVAGLSDHNEIRVIARRSGRPLLTQECHSFGASVMFVSCFDVDEGWTETLRSVDKSESGMDVSAEKEILESGTDLSHWTSAASSNTTISGRLGIENASCLSEYLVMGKRFWLAPGRFRLSGNVRVASGALAVGVLDVSKQIWLITLTFDECRSIDVGAFSVPADSEVQVIISANNSPDAGAVSAELLSLSLQSLECPEGAQGSPKATELELGDELVGADPGSWIQSELPAVRLRKHLVIEGYAKPNEELLGGAEFSLPRGDYLIQADVRCRQGALAIGILDVRRGVWAAVLNFDRLTERVRQTLSAVERMQVKPFIISATTAEAEPIEAEIRNLSCRRIKSS